MSEADKAPATKEGSNAGDSEASVEARLTTMEARLRDLERTASRWNNWATREQIANELIAARQQRDDLFGREIFGEPGWDLLLTLYTTGLRQVRLSLTQLADQSGLANTTVLRWVSKLEEERLIDRQPDPSWGRRILVMLTDRGFDLVSAHLDYLLDAKNEADPKR